MTAPIPEDQLAEIKTAIFSGRKIDAIKLYRKSAGAELVEAKAAVEKLETELRSTSPEYFSRPEGRGCLGVLLAICFVIAAFAAWLIAN